MYTLTELFTSIANSIRAKKGSSGTIKAENFPTEISSIELGKLTNAEYTEADNDVDSVLNNTTVPSGTISITSNGIYDVTDYINANVNIANENNAKIKGTITDIDLRKSIITFDLIDTSSITNMADMFYNYISLTTIPLINTSNVTTMQEMFYMCSSLTTIPLINTSNVTNMVDMFTRCSSLTTIPLIDTSNVTNMGAMFYQCTALTTVPQLDTSKTTTMQEMFSGCNNLTNESLNNILAMCANATSYNATKTLSYIGIRNSSYSSVIPTLSNYQAFINAGWTIA